MKKKIRIHSHPEEEATVGLCTTHRIIDRNLFNAIQKKYGEFFDPAPLPIIAYSAGAECNCAAVSSDMIEGGLAPKFPTHPSWICPAHGYKRL